MSVGHLFSALTLGWSWGHLGSNLEASWGNLGSTWGISGFSYYKLGGLNSKRGGLREILALRMGGLVVVLAPNRGISELLVIQFVRVI